MIEYIIIELTITAYFSKVYHSKHRTLSRVDSFGIPRELYWPSNKRKQLCRKLLITHFRIVYSVILPAMMSSDEKGEVVMTTLAHCDA